MAPDKMFWRQWQASYIFWRLYLSEGKFHFAEIFGSVKPNLLFEQ